MFNLEGLIPKLCQLAQEVGDEERALRLRSAGLQVLAFMVHFFQSCFYVIHENLQLLDFPGITFGLIYCYSGRYDSAC